MAHDKCPPNCPWDLEPGQQKSQQEEWTLVNGNEFVRFSKNKHDANWFNVNKNDEIFEQFLSYQARLTYQKLLDKGFTLQS